MSDASQKNATMPQSEQLLAVIGAMAEQIHPGQNLSSIVSLDKSIERDLGFDSLSRLELLHQVEREFDI
ncbi:MAG: hypothetical protein HON14_17175, partial [Rhodospirillaceae bacterium]|nr:hypothetical protein [Rhodospirillaceae bacterium]